MSWKLRPNQLCSFSWMSGGHFSPPIAYRKYANSSGGRWAHLLNKKGGSFTHPVCTPNPFLWGGHLRVCWKPTHQLTIPFDNQPKQRGSKEPFCQVWQVGNTPTLDSTPISHEAEKSEVININKLEAVSHVTCIFHVVLHFTKFKLYILKVPALLKFATSPPPTYPIYILYRYMRDRFVERK